MPAHRRRADHRVHAELAGRRGLAVPGQRRDADLAPAAHPNRRVAHRRRRGHRRRAVGVVHRRPLRRVRHRLDAQPGRLRRRRADHGADRLGAATPRPHPARGARAARRVLGAHHRRRGDRAVRRGVVAVSTRCGIPSAAGSPTSSACCSIAVPTVVLLLPQFLGVLQQAEIIVGHAFVTHEGKKRGAVRRRRAAHPPPQRLSDPERADRRWPPSARSILLVRRIWWPLAVWLLLVVSIVHSSAPFGGPIGAVTGKFSDLFYSDPRRLSAVVTMLLTADGGHRPVHAGVGRGGRCCAGWSPRAARGPGTRRPPPSWWPSPSASALALPPAAPVPDRREVRPGDHRRQGPRGVRLPGDAAGRPRHPDRQRQHRRHGVDVRRRRPAPAVDALRLPGQQQGPGYHRFIFWAYADDADTDPARRRGGAGAQHPVRDHQHTGGPRVRHARRTSVARQVAVVEEDLRQRRGPHLRVARR